MKKEVETLIKEQNGNDFIADVMRSSSDDKLVEIAVPENSLILTVNATKYHNRKIFKEWMKEFFNK